MSVQARIPRSSDIEGNRNTTAVAALEIAHGKTKLQQLMTTKISAARWFSRVKVMFRTGGPHKFLITETKVISYLIDFIVK